MTGKFRSFIIALVGAGIGFFIGKSLTETPLLNSRMTDYYGTHSGDERIEAKGDFLAPDVENPMNVVDFADKIRRMNLPADLQRQVLLQKMEQIIAAEGYNDEKFSINWKTILMSLRAMLSSVRLEALAKTSPQQFIDLIQTNKPGLAEAADAALGNLVETEPAKAFSLLKELRITAEGKKITGEKLFKAWGRLDPEASLAAARRLGDEKEARQAVLGALRGWLVADPAGGMAAWKAAGETVQNESLTAAGEGWISEIFWETTKNANGPGAAVKLISGLGKAGQGAFMREGFTAISARWPEEAIQEWQKMSEAGWGSGSSGFPGIDSMAGILEGIVWNSPSNMLKLLDSPTLKDGFLKPELNGETSDYTRVSDLIQGNIPEDAVSIAKILMIKGGNGTLWSQLAAGVIEGMILINPEQGKSVLDQFGTSEVPMSSYVKNGIVGSVVAQIAYGDKLIDVTELLDMLPAGNSRQEAAAAYVSALTNADFQTAAQWASKYDNQYPGSIAALVQCWAGGDWGGASQMVKALNPDERQDLIPVLANALARNQPSVSMAWAASIEDAATRTKIMESVARQAGGSGIPLETLYSESVLSSADKESLNRAWLHGKGVK